MHAAAYQGTRLIDWNEGAGAVITGISAGGIYVGQRIESYDLTTGTLTLEQDN